MRIRRYLNRKPGPLMDRCRAIADLDGFDDIHDAQFAEAVQYRTLDRKYWG